MFVIYFLTSWSLASCLGNRWFRADWGSSVGPFTVIRVGSGDCRESWLCTYGCGEGFDGVRIRRLALAQRNVVVADTWVSVGVALVY